MGAPLRLGPYSRPPGQAADVETTTSADELALRPDTPAGSNQGGLPSPGPPGTLPAPPRRGESGPGVYRGPADETWGRLDA